MKRQYPSTCTVIPLSGLAVSIKPAIDSMLWLLINMFVDFQILKDIPRMTSLAHLFQQQVVQEVSMGSDALFWKNGSNSNTYGNSINVELTNPNCGNDLTNNGINIEMSILNHLNIALLICFFEGVFFSKSKQVNIIILI